MGGLAATLAYGMTMFPSFLPESRWPKGSKDSVAPVEPIPHEAANEPLLSSRLVVEDQRAFTNEPLSLGVTVVPVTGNGSLLLGGLIQGTRLSEGVPVSEASWEFPLRDIGGVYVYAPQNFLGVMDAVIKLLSPTKRIIDSRSARLEWLAKPAALQPSKPAIDSGTSSSAVVVKSMDPQDAAALMQRGRDLLKDGDIASAQLAFRRLADVGIAEGALALATTYDPRYVAQHNLIGIVGDETKARVWYQRASELGSKEADRILARTDTK